MIVKKGSKGKATEKWQTILRDTYPITVDGRFGDQTDYYTRLWQTAHGLNADGIVGNKTWAKSKKLGYGEPKPTTKLKALTTAQKEALFGVIPFEKKPEPGNPENIEVDSAWYKQNITRVESEAITKCLGVSSIRVHRKTKAQWLGVFEEIVEKGLEELIETYEGTYNARLMRGSETKLSSHAWATAIDVNRKWNGLGKIPAKKGEKGSVVELVPIFEKWGFYWGGNFKNRPDGMHLEIYVIK